MEITKAQEIINSWQNCLPGDLSNLFYFIGENLNGKEALNRYTTFGLGYEGIDILKNPPAEIDVIRIVMGCAPVPEGKPRQGTPTFTPLLSIVFKDNSHEVMVFPLENVSQESFIKITTGIADLFRQKWSLLSNDEVTNAFHGYTVVDTTGSSPFPLPVDAAPGNLRVSCYTFLNEDVRKIQDYIRNSPEFDVFLKLHLGAGLTVDVIHPFNFRPVLEVGRIVSEYSMDGDDDDGEYYERAQPCPPYCHGGGDGEP